MDFPEESWVQMYRLFGGRDVGLLVRLGLGSYVTVKRLSSYSRC